MFLIFNNILKHLKMLGSNENEVPSCTHSRARAAMSLISDGYRTETDSTMYGKGKDNNPLELFSKNGAEGK